MKVKIRNTVYDGKKEPVMVILTDQDKKNIANMSPGATKYCCYPESYSAEQIKEWMNDIPQNPI